jgi:hypothetical protein
MKNLMPRVCSTPERASQHNAKSLYAVAPPASAPVIETSSVWRRRCDCSGCAPYNLHYVEMPAAQGGLARLSLRGFFDRDRATSNGDPRAALAPTCTRCSTKQGWFAMDGQRSTVLAVSRTDLDTAARGADRDRPTALAVSG